MAKTLILVRHGKSSWDNNLDDHDRPLKSRAFNDIELVTEKLKSHITRDFTFLSSTANRAKTTAEYFLKQLEIDKNEIQQDHELYTFDVNVLKQYIYNLNNDIDKIVIFGHNPAFTSLSNKLGSLLFGNVPTSGVVKIEFDNSNWKDCKQGETKLYLFPKDLRND